jgi:hypothetical protein
MRELRDLIRNADADASVAFRERAYGRGEQGDLLRDVIALANAAVVGRRFLFIGVDDAPPRARRFPGVSARGWKRFCEAVPAFFTRTVEPRLKVAFASVEVDGALVGALCLEGCEDPPYLLARRVSASMPAGGGWIRSGVKVRRLLRKHLQRIFEARYRRDVPGDVTVGFPGVLPREELVLPVLPLDALPSAVAAHRINRMLDAKRVSKAVLGRTDTRIARLVHAQMTDGTTPYREQGTKTMRALLRQVPLENAAADDHYQFEQRTHRINLVLSNLSGKTQSDLVLTLKIPRVEGVIVVDRVYPAPGDPVLKHGLYPTVDAGPRTVTVQVRGLRIPPDGRIEAFFEPLRLGLREPVAGQTVRVAYTLQGGTLERPVQGRLKIYATE